jgi:hypothetical protein
VDDSAVGLDHPESREEGGLKGRFIGYSARHTLATELLAAGRTSTDVAAILGNTAGMVERNYSHVAARATSYRDLLNRRPGGLSREPAEVTSGSGT